MPGHKSPAMKKTSMKRSRTSAKKSTPAVRHLRYELTNSAIAGTETSHYLDLGRDLSILNRRLMRQGRVYHIKKITVVSSNTFNQGNRISASVIAPSWVAREAWKRGFRTWQKMNSEAMHANLPNVQGTWADFKVYMDEGQTTHTLLRPMDNGGNQYALGEWTYAKYVSPDGTTGADQFSAWMLGGHDGPAGSRTHVGLIKSYAESRATVQDGSPLIPSTLSDDPLVNVFDYGTTVDEVLDNIEGDNDQAPYDIFTYPGESGNGPKPLVVQDTTLIDGHSIMGGFEAMLGLIEFEIKSNEPSDVYSVLVEVAPGSYRGIKADVI
ncbi:MAG: hypothetical protein [Circoviridae sp.]|nr:MAG: hypothetical protein [Circoviridae sp.]